MTNMAKNSSRSVLLVEDHQELAETVGSYLEKIFKDGELIATIQEHWITDLTAEKRYCFSLCQTSHQVYDFYSVADCKEALFKRYLA